LQPNIETRQVTFQVSDKDQTSGILSLPGKGHRGTAIILAHGAANDMTHPLLTTFAEGLASNGYPVLRFNFLYTERKRQSPDKETLLAAAWAGAYRFLKKESGLTAGEIVAAGKSLGGRIASQMTAKEELQVNRIIFLGYPLHRMGDTSALHDSHLCNITLPMLFVVGTRDTLCDMAALRGVLSRLRAPHDLLTIEGGDHSFHVPKSAGITNEEIYGCIVAKTVDWLSTTSPV
jgi:predicted alpha/beta-hydrolase family hydrolase